MVALFVGPEAGVGDVQLVMRIHRHNDAADGAGVFADEGCRAESIVAGGGDGEGSARVEIVLDVDEE